MSEPVAVPYSVLEAERGRFYRLLDGRKALVESVAATLAEHEAAVDDLESHDDAMLELAVWLDRAAGTDASDDDAFLHRVAVRPGKEPVCPVCGQIVCDFDCPNPRGGPQEA